jgi:hypothetical protein
VAAGLDVGAELELSTGHFVFTFRVSESGIGVKKKFISRLQTFDFKRVAAGACEMGLV